MTRETKIGLLVGLAFIIVVGILLSEHLTTTTERPAAALADAGRGVRAGVSTPGVGMDTDLAKALEPTRPVPTPSDMSLAPLPQVVVGGPVIPAVPTPAPMAEIPTQPTQADNASPAAPQHTQAPADPFANDPLALDARNQGEPIISILPPEPVKTIAPIPAPSMAANNVREYKAQAGDTLSRIAALLPGGSTPANRDAVIKLNPTLQKDPNKVIAGRTYLLPTDKSLSAAAKKEIKPQTVRVIKAETKTTETRTYIVKRGDTLTKIASEQLGSVKEVQAIRDLNSDVLKGDVVKIDMKLKLPARSVATAN